jgi:peptide/nickel transport system substrate-binding protein
MLKKRQALLLVNFLCLVLLLLAVGCSSKTSGNITQTNAAGDPDILTIVVPTDPITMDPAMNTYFAAHQVSRHIYETLFRLDADFDLLPMLAKKWRYLDDVTIEIELQEGVTFHNGDPLTSEDVLFSLKRAYDDGTAGYANVEAIDFENCKVIDDTTFILVTKEPKANQLALLSNAFTGIFSKSDYEAKNGNFFNKIAGTGPYQLDSYLEGDYYTLVSYDDYWDDSVAGRIKKLHFRVITEGANRAIEAETGGADIVYDITANDKERIKDNPNLQYLYAYSANSNYIFLNTAKAPLDDIRVRKAILHGIDREAVVKMAYKGMGKILNTFFAEGIIGSLDISDQLLERDVEKAKKLLAEAGYENGLALEFAAESNQTMRMDVAEAVQAQLADIGIEIKLNFMDANAYSSYTADGNHDLCIYGLSATTGEAGNGLMRFTPSMSYYTLTSHNDEKILQNIYEGLHTIDEDKRIQLFEGAQRGLMDLYCVLPIWQKEINAAVANYVDMTDFYLDRSYETHLLTGVRFNF